MSDTVFAKNQLLPLTIESLASDGSGVGRAAGGMAVFVPGSAPGDVLEVRIVKALKTYAYGRIERIVAPGPGRQEPDCPVCGPCGGCSLRHLTYEAELAAKTGFVRDASPGWAGLAVPVAPALAAPLAQGYRNKVQAACCVGRRADGRIVTGFYAGRSHRLIETPACKLQAGLMNALAARACALFEQYGVQPYDEQTHTGLVRHLVHAPGLAQRAAAAVLCAQHAAHCRTKASCARLCRKSST